MKPGLIRTGRYRHYKGGLYDVVDLAEDTETHEMLVLYRSTSEPYTHYVRPVKLFTEVVTDNGRRLRRFEYEGEESTATRVLRDMLDDIRSCERDVRTISGPTAVPAQERLLARLDHMRQCAWQEIYGEPFFKRPAGYTPGTLRETIDRIRANPPVVHIDTEIPPCDVTTFLGPQTTTRVVPPPPPPRDAKERLTTEGVSETFEKYNTLMQTVGDLFRRVRER